MNKEDENIKNWYCSKTKLYKIKDLKYLQKYIVNTEQNISNIIQLSLDYKFDYFDLDKMDYKKIKIRPENIFKINFYRVVKKIKEYFIDTDICIEIFFESAGENDNLIKKKNCTFKHDVYIKISNNDKFYDIGLEYFELIHDRIKDNDKEISSKINLDRYYMYNEKDLKYNKFMKETIYSLFLGICALNDNPYVLSKINYFKNHNNNKTLKIDTELFNSIINWKKTNSFNLKKFFERSVIINPETENEFVFDEFVHYLYNNHRIKIIYLDKKYNCEYKYFVDIIMKIESECSDIIGSYRILYSKTMEILFESEKEILEWIRETNNAKRLIPKYIDNFLLNHVKNYKCTYTLEKVHSELSKKYSS